MYEDLMTTWIKHGYGATRP